VELIIATPQTPPQEANQLTPIPFLLRKEGSARDRVSSVMIKILPFGECCHPETILLDAKVLFDFLGMTHIIQHISELPPLYEVERGIKGVSTKITKKSK